MTKWRKSSRSGTSTGQDCIEVAELWQKSGRSGSNDDASCVEVAELCRKSSRSGTIEGQDCVEVARPCSQGGERIIGVRDSKDPDGPKLWISPAAWAALVRDIKSRTL